MFNTPLFTGDDVAALTLSDSCVKGSRNIAAGAHVDVIETLQRYYEREMFLFGHLKVNKVSDIKTNHSEEQAE